jgi:hypothetical protein
VGELLEDPVSTMEEDTSYPVSLASRRNSREGEEDVLVECFLVGVLDVLR